MKDILLRMRWIDDHSLTCLVIRNEIGIIVAATLPYLFVSGEIVWFHQGTHTHGN